MQYYTEISNTRMINNFLWPQKLKVLCSRAVAYPDLRDGFNSARREAHFKPLQMQLRRKNLIKRVVIESVCYNQKLGAVNRYCTSVTRVNLAPGMSILLIKFCNLVLPPPSFNSHYHKRK